MDGRVTEILESFDKDDKVKCFENATITSTNGQKSFTPWQSDKNINSGNICRP